MSLVFVGLALGLAFALGAYVGRTGERAAIASGKVNRGLRPTLDEFERELRKARGVPLHPNPDTATRQKKARIRR